MVGVGAWWWSPFFSCVVKLPRVKCVIIYVGQQGTAINKMNMKNLIKYGYIAVVSCFLIGCNRLDKGVLIHKYHLEEESGIDTGVDFDGNVYVEPYFEPEKWIFVIEGEKNGEFITNEYSVNEKTYESYNLGDSVNLK